MPTTLSSSQKKEYARQLYLDGSQVYTQQEIADKVGISRKTINKWIGEEKWDELRTSRAMTRTSSVNRLYHQVDDILMTIENRPMGERHATPEESQIISKLTDSIRKLEDEKGISETVQVSIKVIEFVKKFNHDKAKEIAEIFDQYIKTLL